VSLLAWIVVFSLVGGVLSVLAAALFLAFSERLRTRALPHLVSFATGALLGAAFLALLPHAVAAPGVEVHQVLGTVLAGVLVFFVLERLVLWRHCHQDACEVHGAEEPGRRPSAGTLVLFGDGLHNFLDGILIGAAFLTDVHLGVVTALAVAAHEIPQEVGDFAVLLHSGYSRAEALWFNVLSSLTTVVGGVLAWMAFGWLQAALPYVLAVAAASFIYVAVADLIPDLHKRVDRRALVEQLALIIAGVVVIYFAHGTLH